MCLKSYASITKGKSPARLFRTFPLFMKDELHVLTFLLLEEPLQVLDGTGRVVQCPVELVIVPFVVADPRNFVLYDLEQTIEHHVSLLGCWCF